MSKNNVINEKKKALLAYKEKLQAEIKNYERSVDDFRSNYKNTSNDEDDVHSSDSEDDCLPHPIDVGPGIPELKLQQSKMKTCLQATQELTSLTVLQSELNVLVDEPKLEGERPVTEAGTWREVVAECRIDLIPFSITFFMHTPDRKFAPPSFRGLRVVPVKNAQEMELAKSVLHNLKTPSDIVEVLKSYAVGYRSRRTTLARLANKYANALFMEPHPEGGFILKCADLLEVSWRLENKWSPVAPFHHRMKFDLEYMDESYIKIITQAHKQLLDPAIQTDERTLLLAKIISTCLEARGPIDPESDLESKTTERDNDIEKRESDTEKHDSEVMAPPKTLPKKMKQKNKSSLPNPPQKRSTDNENGDNAAKKMKHDVPTDGSKNMIADNNVRKSKLSDVVSEGGKKRKINDGSEKNVTKIASSKNDKETDDIESNDVNTKLKNMKTNNEAEKGDNTRPKNMKSNNETEKGDNLRTKNMKSNNEAEKGDNSKPKNMKINYEAEKGDNPRTKNMKSNNEAEKGDNTKPKNMKSNDEAEKGDNPRSKNMKGNNGAEKGDNTKPKNMKSNNEAEKGDNTQPKNMRSNNESEKGDNTKPKNIKSNNEAEKGDHSRPKNMKSNHVAEKGNNNKTKKLKTNNEAEKGDIIRPKNMKSNNEAEKDDNTRTKNIKSNNEAEKGDNPRPKNMKEAGKTDDKDGNAKANIKNAKEAASTENSTKSKPKIAKNSGKNENEGDKIKSKDQNVKEAGNTEKNEGNTKSKNKMVKKPSNIDQAKTTNTKPKKSIAKEADHPENNVDQNAQTKNVEKKKSVANVKSKENIDANKITEKKTKDAERPKNMAAAKNNNANTKNTENNPTKVGNKPKNAIDPTKGKENKVANTKNDAQGDKTAPDKTTNKEKQSEIANRNSEIAAKDKPVTLKPKNNVQTVKKVTEKNAAIKIKDKISTITNNKVTEKNGKDKVKPKEIEPEKVISENFVTKKDKELPTNKKLITQPLKTIKNITPKIQSHRNSLKVQNPQKVLKPGSIKKFSSGNTEKENSGKMSKIPQKKISLNNEGSSKQNLLRISPRQIPSKFKTLSQGTLKQKLMKTTNIPRLLKKPAPKT